jgi:hypothetical protein
VAASFPWLDLEEVIRSDVQSLFGLAAAPSWERPSTKRGSCSWRARGGGRRAIDPRTSSGSACF